MPRIRQIDRDRSDGSPVTAGVAALPVRGMEWVRMNRARRKPEKGRRRDPSGWNTLAGWVFFTSAAAATFTISSPGPWFRWAYSFTILALSIAVVVRRPGVLPALSVSHILAATIACYGWVQYTFSWTEYRYATMVASLHWTACFATLFTGAGIFAGAGLGGLRENFLRAFGWLGFVAAVVGVLANLTSPGAILWIFPSPYPDSWGMFLSRNDFAMFLELSLPVAFWGAWRPPFSKTFVPKMIFLPTIPLWVPACMLAAGLASASRAGAALLLSETVFCLILLRKPRSGPTSMGTRASTGTRTGRSSVRQSFALRYGAVTWLRRPAARFLTFTLVAISIAGFSPLRERLREADPFQFRREIAASTLAMIHRRPLAGFGLGTFPQVYPAYACFDAGALVDHAHNDWLEWSAEGGIPFAALWGMLAVTLAFPAIRSRWGVGLVAIFLHGLVDYPFAKIGLTAWIFALAGILQAEGERTPSPNALTRERQENPRRAFDESTQHENI